MQALIPKSSCTPPRGATRVMQSTEGAKAARWRLNQLDRSLPYREVFLTKG